jgi:uncharacterized protein YgfB (UPF0149 family)
MNDFEIADLAEQLEGLHEVVEVLQTLLHDCCCDEKDSKPTKKGKK